MKEELEQLQKGLDALKQKYEDSIKPKFEVGKWYKKGKALIYFKEKGSNNYGFDIDYGKWEEELFLSEDGLKNGWIEATPQEVQEALEKEAVKRGAIYDEYVLTLDNGFYGDNGNRLIELFNNGTWASIISEPKTIDELCEELYNYVRSTNGSSLKCYKEYFLNNKSEIIETLKNLD